VNTLTWIARARILQDEPEEAATTLIDALDDSLNAGYRMGVQGIRGVRTGIPGHCANLPTVRELDERLQTA
jgi:hypothetical protein